MATSRQHRKPEVPKEALEAERVAKQMYASLTLKTAPSATPAGYILGACTLRKAILDQAGQKGGDREQLRQLALDYIGKI